MWTRGEADLEKTPWERAAPCKIRSERVVNFAAGVRFQQSVVTFVTGL